MVYITGDIHGSLDPIRELCNKYNPTENDIIVILGDVGLNYYGGHKDKRVKYQLNDIGCKFFCIHGNHENRPQNIPTYKEKKWMGGRVLYENDYPNLLFPLDGDIFTLEDKKCLIIGGAYSVDKYYRLSLGYNWWADEQPSPSIKAYVECQTHYNDVDIVFSHTCPAKYKPTECFLSGIDQESVDDSTEQWLDKIEERLDYQAWYVGHWHTNKRIDKMHFLYHEVETL